MDDGGGDGDGDDDVAGDVDDENGDAGDDDEAWCINISCVCFSNTITVTLCTEAWHFPVAKQT